MAEISKRPDVNPKEGTSQYGDVSFADEKNKKYPIDTAEHIRAAWNYINQARNAGKYSAEEVATIKHKIVAAWKDKIDKGGPPGAEKMTEANPEIDEMLAGVKVAGDWTLDVLGVPFGGPHQGKDADGQFFSEKTNIREDFYKEIPAFYYHSYDSYGRPQGDPVLIGKATYDHKDERGHWYKVILDKTKEFAGKVWEAAQKGVALASSGTIGHLIRDDKSSGEILHWPAAELSLTDGSHVPFHAAN